MKIQVTAEDIAEGVRKSPYRCAVACAVRRITGEHGRFDVSVYPLNDGPEIFVNRRRSIGPVHVTEKLRSWDEGGDMEPFEFETEDFR
jgi:hypothetical protein